MMAMTALFASGAATAGTVAAGTAAAGAATAAGAVGSTFAAAGSAAATSFLGASGTLGTAAAASASTAGLFGSLTTLDILGGVFDAVSLVGGVLGTRSEIAQAEQLGRDRDLQALQLSNQATLDEINALEELRARISQSVVSAFAGGLAPTGSVAAGIEQAVEQQEFETTVGGRDARIRAERLKIEGEAARDSTSATLIKGVGEAASTVFNFFDRRDRRGPKPGAGRETGMTVRG